MEESVAFELRNCGSMAIDRRIQEFIELVNMFPYSTESNWKHGGCLEEGKVEVTSSYEYWSIESEKDAIIWIQYELKTFISQNTYQFRQFIESSTTLDNERKQGLLFLITNTSAFISNLTGK